MMRGGGVVRTHRPPLRGTPMLSALRTLYVLFEIKITQNYSSSITYKRLACCPIEAICLDVFGCTEGLVIVLNTSCLTHC